MFEKISGTVGTVTEFNWRMLKLFDLNKAMVGISKNERSVLLTLIEVMDEGWVFTISVVVVGAEKVKRGIEMSESTREVFATHSGTGGDRKSVV